nr:nucleoside diphosphate kinase-like [Lepeophtheirus salmonis]
MNEITYIMIKPDGLRRQLGCEILSIFEKIKDLQLMGLKIMVPSKDKLTIHYRKHKHKPFFKDIMAYMGSGDPILCSVWCGPNAVQKCRKLIGNTDPLKAKSGTVRFKYALSKVKNAIHGSDSVESGKFEAFLWFSDQELLITKV